MMMLQSTSHWHTQFTDTEPSIYIRIGDSIHILVGAIPGLDDLIYQVIELTKAVSKLADSLRRLLELLLILIAIALEGMELAVTLCNRLYGACVKADRQLDLWIEQVLNACMLFYVGFERVAMRGLG